MELFCGVGGLTHGLARGGIRVAAGYDVDPDCRFAYEGNNQARFFERDIRELNGDELRSRWGSKGYTLLAGCAPCQPFSTYSRKYGGARRDTKWELVEDFGRLVSESQPDFITAENVPQLLDHDVFQKFLSMLAGYNLWYGGVECAQYGVPQTRKRLVLLGSKHGPIEMVPPSRINEWATVRGAISHLMPLHAGESDPNDLLHTACRLSDLNLRRIRASHPGGTWRDWDEELVAECHRKQSGETYPSVYGRMEWDAPAPTITTQCFGYGNGRFGHPEQDRAITLREAAILQTFPDSYQFIPAGQRAKFSVVGKLIGNAVPVRLGEWIGRSFQRHLNTVKRTRRSVAKLKKR